MYFDYDDKRGTIYTAVEKEKAVNAIIKFFETGCEKEKFTKRIYNTLHLHCGFIACFNREGFYFSYFGSLGAQCMFLEALIDSVRRSGGPWKDAQTRLGQWAGVALPIWQKKAAKELADGERAYLQHLLDKHGAPETWEGV